MDDQLLDRLVCGLSTRQGEARPRTLASLVDWMDRPVDLETLMGTGLIVRDGDALTLTAEALGTATMRWSRMMKRGFDEGLVGNMHSAAYMKFNRMVYGFDRFQFNMIDAEQADLILQFANLSAGMRFVDLGCATGTMTQWIAEQSGAHGLGLDFAPRAIAEAKSLAGDRGDLQFEEGDLNDLPTPETPFDVAFALDTLYFPSNLEHTLRRIRAMLTEGGRLVAPYSDNTRDPRAPIEPEQSKLGLLLDALGWDWVAVEVSAMGIWDRAMAALTELKPLFVEEGSEAIWRSRHREASEMQQCWAEGRAQRWIFVIRPGDPASPPTEESLSR